MRYDRLIIFNFFASFLLLLLSSFLISRYLWSLRGLSLIIRFDSLRGLVFFGSFSDSVYILLSAFFSLTLNLFLSFLFYRRERFISYFFSFFSLFFSILILVWASVTIGVN